MRKQISAFIAGVIFATAFHMTSYVIAQGVKTETGVAIEIDADGNDINVSGDTMRLGTTNLVLSGAQGAMEALNLENLGTVPAPPPADHLQLVVTDQTDLGVGNPAANDCGLILQNDLGGLAVVAIAVQDGSC